MRKSTSSNSLEGGFGSEVGRTAPKRTLCGRLGRAEQGRFVGGGEWGDVACVVVGSEYSVNPPHPTTQQPRTGCGRAVGVPERERAAQHGLVDDWGEDAFYYFYHKHSGFLSVTFIIVFSVIMIGLSVIFSLLRLFYCCCG